MNPSYISTAFHRETGMTIKEYILWQKTEEGKQLLSPSGFRSRMEDKAPF